MMVSNNPIARKLEEIKNQQKSIWDKLDKKDTWTKKDFYYVLESIKIWDSKKRDWIPDPQRLEQLAYDLRTPQPLANNLIDIYKRKEKANKRRKRNRKYIPIGILLIPLALAYLGIKVLIRKAHSYIDKKYRGV